MLSPVGIRIMLHGALIDCRVNTNEWRAALHYVRRRIKLVRKTPLMELGTRLHDRDGIHIDRRHGSWDRLPIEVLLEAFGHIEMRLERLREYPSTGRVRKHEKWLGKWQQRICAEIDRRRSK